MLLFHRGAKQRYCSPWRRTQKFLQESPGLLPKVGEEYKRENSTLWLRGQVGTRAGRCSGNQDQLLKLAFAIFMALWAAHPVAHFREKGREWNRFGPSKSQGHRFFNHYDAGTPAVFWISNVQGDGSSGGGAFPPWSSSRKATAASWEKALFRDALSLAAVFNIVSGSHTLYLINLQTITGRWEGLPSFHRWEAQGDPAARPRAHSQGGRPAARALHCPARSAGGCCPVRPFILRKFPTTPAWKASRRLLHRAMRQEIYGLAWWARQLKSSLPSYEHKLKEPRREERPHNSHPQRVLRTRDTLDLSKHLHASCQKKDQCVSRSVGKRTRSLGA